MRQQRNLPLAIRTVLVTTRAAVSSNVNSGDQEMARVSARRGLALLESVALGPQTEDQDVSRAYVEARRELRELAGLEHQPAAIAFEIEGPLLPSRTHRRSPSTQH